MVIVSILFFGFPVWNLARLRGSKHVLWIITPIIIFISLFAFSNLLEERGAEFWYTIVKTAAYYWLIISMMLFAMSVIWMLVKWSFKIDGRKIFWLIIISTLLYGGIARVSGSLIVTKELNLPASNITRDYEFVHITDLHSGSTDREHAQRVVDRIQPLDPEFVVITGDFIDEFHVEPADIEPFNELTMPIYLITGNHEYYLESGKINDVIAETDIQLIDGMRIEYEELDIIGVNELATVDNTLNELGGVNPDRYTILLDHQPKTDESHRAESNGVRLMLSGHTHAGQVWPMSWLVQLQFKYISGLYEIGQMFLYVNQGTGTLGPPMRFGTANEVTSITLQPQVNN